MSLGLQRLGKLLCTVEDGNDVKAVGSGSVDDEKTEKGDRFIFR